MLSTPLFPQIEAAYFLGLFSVESRTALVIMAAVACLRSLGSSQPVTFSEEPHTSQIK